MTLILGHDEEFIFTFQLRLDFTSFVLSGPSTSSLTVAKRVPGAGVVVASVGGGATASVAEMGRCVADSFSVSSPGAEHSSPPVICGTNSGEHSESAWTQ